MKNGWQVILKKRLVLGLFGLALMGLGPNSWGDDAAKVPCGSKETGLSDCAEVKKRSIELVGARAKEFVESWYDGEVFDEGICCITKNRFNSFEPEIEKSHHGESCGEWSRLKHRIRRKKKRVDVLITVDARNQAGSRERAYMAGVKVQMMDSLLAEISKEIESGAISVGVCREALKDFNGVTKDMEGGLKSFSEQVKTANTREVLNKCDPETQSKLTAQNENDDSLGLKSERLGMQACRLLAVRAASEAMFQQIAMCELNARVDDAYDRFLLNVSDPVLMKRLDQWAKACKGCGADIGCANRCYQGHFLDYLRGETKKRTSIGASEG
jgi:hypothetical protein